MNKITDIKNIKDDGIYYIKDDCNNDWIEYKNQYSIFVSLYNGSIDTEGYYGGGISFESMRASLQYSWDTGTRDIYEITEDEVCSIKMLWELKK